MGWLAGAAVRSPTVAVAVTLAGSELRRVATSVGRKAAVDLAAARAELPSLVGRDPSELSQSQIAAAAIESVAENTVDAVVAPVFWALVAGAPGAAAYRAVNTMDAMAGHRNDRYERFGWASARLDDVANYLPARLFAILIIACRPGRRHSILRAATVDGALHPSPNAGVAEAAVAGALGVELGGRLRYGPRVEDRPTLGQGPRPQPGDVDEAVALVDRAERLMLAAILAAGFVASGLPTSAGRFRLPWRHPS